MSSSPNFRDSTNRMVAQAAALANLPEGLAEKIQVCNATSTRYALALS